jgi:hypothetical protein
LSSVSGVAVNSVPPFNCRISLTIMDGSPGRVAATWRPFLGLWLSWAQSMAPT